MSLISNL